MDYSIDEKAKIYWDLLKNKGIICLLLLLF